MKFLLPLVCLTLVSARAQLFHPDPGHPWNELHRNLNTRTTFTGETYVHYGLEPASVPRSKFLIEGKSRRRTLRLLDDLLASNQTIKDPVKRAIMQRDLYAVFIDTADADLPTNNRAANCRNDSCRPCDGSRFHRRRSRIYRTTTKLPSKPRQPVCPPIS